MPEYTEYQRKMLVWLSFLSVCRFVVDKDSSGKYTIRKAGKIRIAVYYFLWTNSFIKVVYLILTYHGLTKEVHFLDQMSMWDWFLCFSQLVQEVNLWYRKYPLYEVLHANWTVQEDVYKKLGFPKHLDMKINNNDRSLVYLHSAIVTIGCSALLVQNFADPKYALNTYAIVPYENFPLQLLFTAHEILYMYHIWVHQAVSIVLCEIFSVTYTHIISEMTQIMYKLITLGEVNLSTTPNTTDEYANEKKAMNNERNYGIETVVQSSANKRNRNGLTTSKMQPILSTLEIVDPHTLIAKKELLNPKTIVPGTKYNIETLLRDYKHIMIASDSFNKWVGKLMAGTNGSNYGQFISDVFMMIQLLKEPGTDFMAVFFYFVDACLGMIMLFRMLILMSRLYPSSEDFLQAFKVYLTYDSPIKKYLLKYERTLKIVAAKIGGYKTRPITVPKGVNALMNYYIAAAMWQRPKDRMT